MTDNQGIKVSKNKKNVHAALDIGNSKIACMIAQEVESNNVQIKVLGFGQHVSMGLTKGKVTNLSKLSDAIARAVESAEKMAGFSISEINCNINGGMPKTILSKKSIPIKSNFISNEDINKVIKKEDVVKVENFVLLNKNVIRFLIDNDFEVENPIGLKSKTLSVEMNNIIVNKDVISNLTKTIELCHLSVNNFYITPEVSGIATMIREERENSAIVLDIGANITSIGVYLKGKLIFSDTIPLGGIHITSDLVKGLGTESNEAEKIKVMHGSVESTNLDDYNNLKIQIISENGDLIFQEIPRSMIVAIIKPRVEEIFEIIFDRLKKIEPQITNINRIILTGGTSDLLGIANIAKSFFNCNVRIGKPIGLIGVPDIAQSPAFSCLTGLILKSFNEKRKSVFTTFKNQFSSKFEKIGLWFNENL